MRHSRLLLMVFELGESTPMTFLTAVLFLVLSVGIVHGAEEAVCADPNVMFCDNFNDRTLGNGDLTTNKGGRTLGWGVSDTATQSVVDVGCQDGGKCLKQVYPDLSTPKNKDNGGGGFLSTPILPSVRESYYRVWLYYSPNWVAGVDGSGSKIIYHQDGINSTSDVTIVNYNPNSPVNATGVDQNYFCNMNTSLCGVRSPSNGFLGVWQCLESHVILESVPGARDGTYDAWINDTQVAHYTGTTTARAPGPGVSNVYLLSSYWNCLCRRGMGWQCDAVPGSGDNASQCIDPINAHPLMYRLADRVVISRARIGCGTLPQQPMAPAPPAGLNVSWLVPFLATAGGMALVLRRG